MRIVGIIGASGFIGSHMTKRFLSEGFRVRGSTTNISDNARHAHLSSLEHAENLELRELDCRDLDSTMEFVRGLDVLIHRGTPFQLDFEDPEKELLEPTITETYEVDAEFAVVDVRDAAEGYSRRQCDPACTVAATTSAARVGASRTSGGC